PSPCLDSEAGCTLHRTAAGASLICLALHSKQGRSVPRLAARRGAKLIDLTGHCGISLWCYIPGQFWWRHTAGKLKLPLWIAVHSRQEEMPYIVGCGVVLSACYFCGGNPIACMD
ncbi:hypothetical protein XELAEV_18017140mg, partial [Xenopus laevis]